MVSVLQGRIHTVKCHQKALFLFFQVLAVVPIKIHVLYQLYIAVVCTEWGVLYGNGVSTTVCNHSASQPAEALELG